MDPISVPQVVSDRVDLARLLRPHKDKMTYLSLQRRARGSDEQQARVDWTAEGLANWMEGPGETWDDLVKAGDRWLTEKVAACAAPGQNTFLIRPCSKGGGALDTHPFRVQSFEHLASPNIWPEQPELRPAEIADADALASWPGLRAVGTAYGIATRLQIEAFAALHALFQGFIAQLVAANAQKDGTIAELNRMMMDTMLRHIDAREAEVAAREQAQRKTATSDMVMKEGIDTVRELGSLWLGIPPELAKALGQVPPELVSELGNPDLVDALRDPEVRNAVVDAVRALTAAKKAAKEAA